MSTTAKIFLWLLIFGLAVLLDLAVLMILRAYRRLRTEEQDLAVDSNRWSLLKNAFKLTFPGKTLAGPCEKPSVRSESQRVRKTGNPRTAKIYGLTRNLLGWPFINLVAAVGAMYAGQYLMVHIPMSRLWGLTIILGGIALAYFRNRMAAPSEPDWTDGLQIGLGFLIELPLALNVRDWMTEIAASNLIILWLVSICLVAIPALKLKPKIIGTGWYPSEPLDKRDWSIIAVLILGAFLLRVISLDTVPLPIDPDEASLGLYFKDVAEGRYKHPFGTGWATHPGLQWFFLVPLTYVFKNPVFLMRFPSVIYGTMAVGALYLAARFGFGKRVAILAGILLMASDVGIHFSRLGVNNISDSLFASWTMAGLWAAASTGNPLAYILTGFGMGLSQYYYFGNRALPFVVLASLLIWGLMGWRQFRNSWKLLVYIFLVFLVVAGPLLGLMIREPQSLDRVVRVATFFTKKWEMESVDTGQSLSTLRWQQVRDSLLVFTVEPDRGTFYHPGRAMLSSILAPLFFIGILILIKEWRQPSRLSLLSWIVVILTLGSVLINTAATFQRLLGLYPAVILVTALGLERSAEGLRRVLPINWLTSGRLAGVLVAVAVVSNLFFYFIFFNTRVVWKPPDYEAGAIVVHEYRQLDGQGTFVLHTRLGVDDDGTIYLPLFKLATGNDFIGSLSLVDSEKNPRPIYFYLFHDKLADLPDLKESFPGGDIRVYRRQADGEMIMIRYTVP